MKISYFNNLILNNGYGANIVQKKLYSPIQKDICDIKFKGLHKNDFSGLDLMIVELFKAPIEKFINKNDFNLWAENKIQEILNQQFKARTPEATAQRKATVQDWYSYLSDKNGAYFENKPLQFLILSSITSGLKENNDKTPPVLNGGALANTIKCMEEKLSENPKEKLSFLKIYNFKLQEIYASIDYESRTSKGVWVAIPSCEHDKENFGSNVEKLKALSHPNWCTASTQAEPYLEKGDFHIYIADGKPKVGIRMVGDKIAEIQGQRNNSQTPLLYSEEIRKYTQENNIEGLEENIQTAVEKAKKYAPLKEELKQLKERKDYLAIFNHPEFNCEAQMLDSGYLKIKRFISHDLEYFGINPNELMDAVEIVDGDFDLDATNITRFKNLKVVNGNLDLSNSLMETTGSLERVRGELKLDSTKTEIGDNLVDVEKGIYDTSEPYGTNNYLNAIVLLNKISNAKSKKKILEALGIKAKELEDGTLKIASYNPSELENFILLRSYTEDPFSAMGIDEEDLLDGVSIIVGDLYLQDTNITTVKTVKKVGGDVILGNSNLKSLGSIKGVRGNIYAHDSKLKSLGNLIIAGGDADFSNTDITSTRYLKKVGGNLNLKNTNVKKINYLTGENLGGKLYIDPYLFPMLDETLYQLGLEDKTIIE